MCIEQRIEVPPTTPESAPSITPPQDTASPPATTSPPITSEPPPAMYHIYVSVRCDSDLSDDQIRTILSQYMILETLCALTFCCPSFEMVCGGWATEEDIQQILKLEFVYSVDYEYPEEC